MSRVWGPPHESQHLHLNPQYFSLIQSLPTLCTGQPPTHSEETGSNLLSPFPDPGSVLILPVMKCRHVEESPHACRSCPETRRAVSQMSKRSPRGVQGNVYLHRENLHAGWLGGFFLLPEKKKNPRWLIHHKGQMPISWWLIGLDHAMWRGRKSVSFYTRVPSILPSVSLCLCLCLHLPLCVSLSLSLSHTAACLIHSHTSLLPPPGASLGPAQPQLTLWSDEVLTLRTPPLTSYRSPASSSQRAWGVSLTQLSTRLWWEDWGGQKASRDIGEAVVGMALELAPDTLVLPCHLSEGD